MLEVTVNTPHNRTNENGGRPMSADLYREETNVQVD
jgi:hypothetical protein